MDTNNTTERIDQRLATRSGQVTTTNFRKFLVEGTKPNLKKINDYVERSLMLVTALPPSLRQGVKDRALRHGQRSYVKGRRFEVGFVTEAEFDRVVDSKKMVRSYVGARLADAGTA
jgi:fumarate hydratase, class II